MADADVQPTESVNAETDQTHTEVNKEAAQQTSEEERKETVDESQGIDADTGQTHTKVNKETSQQASEEDRKETVDESQDIDNSHHEVNEQPDNVDDKQKMSEGNGKTRTLPELPTAVSPPVSITAILNDVEFEDNRRKPPSKVPSAWEDTTISSRRSQLARSKEKEDVKLPSITPRHLRKRRRPVKKRISNSPPKHYYEHRYILHNRIRLTKMFTKPPKFAILQKPVLQLLKSEANYIRMCRIILTLGTVLLRDVLKTYMDRIYPPKDLKHFLTFYKRRLIGFASTQKLLQDRWKTLFYDDEHEVQLYELDPALIFWFVRHVCHFKKQTDLIWKWKPAINDVTLAADVTRIRDMRNGLLNATDYALYDEEYERKIEEFKAVTLRLSGEKRAAEMVDRIKEINSVTVKISEREENLQILRKWAEETKDRYIDKIAPCKQDWETVRDCKEATRRFLKRFSRPKVFAKTTIYKQAKKHLLKKGVVIIKGNSGEGKTTTALALMSALYEEDEILVMTSPEQWKYINKHTVGAILFDDFLGSMHYEEKQLTDWEGYFDEMYRGCAGKKSISGTPRHCEICSSDKRDRTCAKVIITVRKHIFDQCSQRLAKYKLFATDHVFECSSRELAFSEKREILSKHIVADHKVKTEVDKSAKLPISKLGFPQSCAVFVSQDVFLDLGSQFFERPIEVMQHYLDDLYHKDMYGYLALVIMMFQPGAVLFAKKLEVFTNGDFKKQLIDLAGVCEIPITDNLPSFCLMALSKTLRPYVYFYDDIRCYTFVHESIMEIMMSKFVERHPQYVLESCGLQFVVDYVTTIQNIDVPRDQIFMMRIKKQNFLLLAQLFDHYMSYGYVVQIAQHRALRDPQFLQYFFNYIRKKDTNEDLILRVDNSVKEKREYRHVGFLFGAIDQDKPNVQLAIAILQLGFHVKRSFNPEWCLAELRSSLCAAAKRGNFAIYSALVATKIDIPDKLLTDKEYLTSIDIVSDVLWKRPWSKEQKDIALVQASRLTSLDSSEVVSLLLQHDASVSSIRCGTTALCEAVKSGNAKTVALLLLSGASVYDRDIHDQSPLHHACDWNRIETAKLLLQKGADVNAKDKSGLSPFLVAAGWGREEIMQLFLTKRVDPLAIDELENTFLHICAANGQTRVMNAIISRFPDEIKPILIARNKSGWTPLDFAIKCGHLGAAKLLVRAILQVDIQKPGFKSFVHTRFSIVKPEDLDKDENSLHRFIDLDSEKPCFQIPRGKWYIEAGTQDDYEKVTHFVSKYEDRLKLRFAKS